MHTARFVSILLWLVLPLALPARGEITVTDDADRTLRLRAPAQRIVSLAPHATELVFAAGAGDRLVGISAFSDYPETARALPQVSGGVRLDIERIVALRPDLVIGWLGGNARTDLDKIQLFGIPVFIAEPRRLDQLPRTLVEIGRLAGTEPEAGRAAAAYRDRLAELRARYRERKPVRVFVMISTQPLMTLNHAHLLQDVLTLCGGRNIFAAEDTLAPTVGLESVAIESPDAILFSSALGSPGEIRDWWRERVELRAVRGKRVYAMPADLTLRQTPRILDGAQQVCESLDAARASLTRER
jgi:iron complex transport system substrate-binding protein